MWFPVNGPEDLSYILSLYKTETSGDMKIWEPSAKETSIAYDGPTLEESKVYYWKVKSFSPEYGVQSEDSETHRFTKKAAVGKPDAPVWCTGSQCQGQSSFYAYSDTGIILYWKKPADSVKKFYLYRCQDTAGTCGGTVTATISNTLCAGKTNSVCFEDTNLERGHDYYYSLVAVDSGETESDPSDTPTKITVFLEGPTLVSPVLGQIIYVPNPTFEWIDEPGATQYIVQVVPQSSNHFSIPDAIIWSYTTTGTMATFNQDGSAKAPLENPTSSTESKNYEWRVCAINDLYPLIQADNCSGPRLFKKNLSPPLTISPLSERVVDNEITFKWTASPGATSYKMRVCTKMQNSTSTSCDVLPIIYQAETDGLSQTMTGIVLNNCDLINDSDCSDGGTYYWDVRAYDEYGRVSLFVDDSTGSGSWAKFYKAPMQAPALLIPADGQVVGPYPTCGLGPDFYGNPTYNYQIMFAWTELEQAAGSYRMRIESIEATADGGPASGTVTVDPHIVTVYEETIASTSFNTNDNCGGGTYVIPFSAGTKYRWNVTTPDTPYDPDNSREFITGLPAPNLIAPTNNEMVMQDSSCGGGAMKLCVHFDWNGGTWTNNISGITEEIPGVIGASGYDIEINKCNPAGDCYPVHCEYDALIPPADQKSTTFTTNTFCDLATTSVSNDETFKWRVRARDATGEITESGSGLPGPWSQMYQFTVSIPPVQLATPPDNSSQCDPYNFPDTIIQNCTVVNCLDMYYSWSPQPHANSACYRIEISDTRDFRNIIWADNSPNTTVGGNINEFPCTYYQCYQADVGSKSIPMMNGVTYYWRVGSSVTAGTNCGATWVYSDTWEYFKRPPMPTDLTVSGVGENSVTLNWRPPVDCHGNLSTPSQQISFPDVPPDTGGYIVYLEQSLPDAASPPTHVIGRVGYASANPSFPASNLSPDTDYYLCLVTVDGSGFETHPGHISNFQCAFTHTLASAEE